jgi:hypothetical protein
MKIVHRWGSRASEASFKQVSVVYVAKAADSTHPKCKIGDAPITQQRRKCASWPTKQSKCPCPHKTSTLSDATVNKVTTSHSNLNSSSE